MKSSTALSKSLALVLFATTTVTICVTPTAFGTVPNSTGSIAAYFAPPEWTSLNPEDPFVRLLSVKPYNKILAEQSDRSFHYSLDKNSVPLARSADGTNARFLVVTANHLKAQVLQKKQLTQLEFLRRSEKESFLEISTPGQR